MKVFLLSFAISINHLTLWSQTDPITQTNDLKIYYDCQGQDCDEAFIKQNLEYVQFMRDRKYADVHVLITQQTNGSGGNQVLLRFIGRNEFESLSDTLMYHTDPTQTGDEKRRLQMKYVQIGLMRFFIEKGLIDKMTLSFETQVENKGEDETLKKDPWNYFVFKVSAGGWLNGQETSNSASGNGSFSVKRVTDKNKFSLYNSFNVNASKYTFGEDTITSYRQSIYSSIYDVISITDHWSYGFIGNINNNIFSNYQISTSLKGGIEYNLFPYTKSAVKQLTLGYKIGPSYNNYYDTTLFNKTEELLLSHNITLGGSVKQKWGAVSASIDYQNYLHDFELNSFNFYLNFDVRLFKGFNWYFYGSYSINHNQINLRKPNGLTQGDLLLQQKQFKSGYNYWMNTGLSYSFGSIYNTIVNPRFNF
jgi:hypothetical protein